jgi:hypothetical protein
LQFAAQVKQIHFKNAKKIESSVPGLAHQVHKLHVQIVHKQWIRQLEFSALTHSAALVKSRKKPLGKSKTA